MSAMDPCQHHHCVGTYGTVAEPIVWRCSQCGLTGTSEEIAAVHTVTFTSRRVECLPDCPAAAPHMNERREWRPHSPLQPSPPSCMLCGSMTTGHVCPVRPGSKP